MVLYFILSAFISWNLSIGEIYSFLLFGYIVICSKGTFKIYPPSQWTLG